MGGLHRHLGGTEVHVVIEAIAVKACRRRLGDADVLTGRSPSPGGRSRRHGGKHEPAPHGQMLRDRKSTRLNSSHVEISYAVFCLKKKNTSPDWRFTLISYIIHC